MPTKSAKLARRALILGLCLVWACAAEEKPAGDDPSAGSAGTGGSASAGRAGSASGSAGKNASAGASGSGGSANGGGTTSGGSGGVLAGSAGMGGSGGRSSQSGGTSNAGASGASGATAGAGASNGGTQGEAGTSLGGSDGGGTAGSGAGTAGSGGVPNDDRCGVANEGDDPPSTLTLSGNLGTHDPVMIEAAGTFYLFSTGDNIGAKTSDDLLAWQGVPDVWNSSTRPDWIADEVPDAENLWAPDISYFGGQYHLYYSASSFGCNVSCIGHATRAALDSGSWTDHGSVVCSNPGSSCDGNRPDNWNAIDPNVIVDTEGTPWLAFGSFWGGLKLVKLDANGARADTTLHSIAARPDDDGALEAPFIVRRCGYYYLFTSWDSCCRRADSTYNTRVGRSESVTGPYVDKAGTPLMQGGGTLVLEGGTRYRGPGHNAVLFTGTAAYNIYHSYDANNNGDSVLRISELVWDDDGWPISGGP